ncbi:MAG: protein-glutamine gamma-glutamyltransferase [Oscillospiraceae bacterium]|jgi:protein-glutamine gamma-glutamyltransferase|nr:protein-glutamine gamma-glutamyltransferase [Oscillospiraceae bacterium]
MIYVDNKPVDTNQLISQFPPNGIENEVINILSKSSKKYNYDSMDQLVFEIKLRKEIVQSSNDLYNSDMGFEIFRKSRCNPKYWKRTDEGGFKLKDGVKPSDAIKDIFVNGSLYGTECATAMIIIYYKALLNIFPEELFNKLFSEIHLMNWHYIDRLLKDVGYMEDTKDYLPGDRRYFKNPEVNPKTPEWQGENVIDMSKGMYYGHGMGKYNAEKIIKELNENRKPGATKSAYLMESVGRPNFKNLSNIYYKNINP